MRVGMLVIQCELCRADSGGSVPLAAPGDESAKASTQESPVWCNRDGGNGLLVTHERLISLRSGADRRMWLALRLPARAACEPRHNTAFVIVKRRTYSGKFAGPLPLSPSCTAPRSRHDEPARSADWAVRATPATVYGRRRPSIRPQGGSCGRATC